MYQKDRCGIYFPRLFLHSSPASLNCRDYYSTNYLFTRKPRGDKLPATPIFHLLANIKTICFLTKKHQRRLQQRSLTTNLKTNRFTKALNKRGFSF